MEETQSSFTFVVPGRPVSWKRASSTGKRRFTSKAMAIAQQRIRIVAKREIPDGWSREGQFALTVHAYFAREPRCDVDNLLKLVADALQGIAFDDDVQVVNAGVVKWWPGEERTEVRVMRGEGRE